MDTTEIKHGYNMNEKLDKTRIQHGWKPVYLCQGWKDNRKGEGYMKHSGVGIRYSYIYVP